MERNNKTNETTGKPIFKSYIAKQLVNMGNRIVDLQTNKHVENATVFYFKDTKKFQQDLEKITLEREERRKKLAMEKDTVDSKSDEMMTEAVMS